MTPPTPPGSEVVDQLYRVGYRVAYQILRAYWFVFRPVTRGVQVAVWLDSRLLVLRNSYRPHVGVPGGGIGRREEPAAAARRELAEETGIELPLARLTSIGVIESRHDHVLDRCHFFEVQLEHAPDVRVDRREVVWAGFMSREELARSNLHAPVRDYLAQHPGE